MRRRRARIHRSAEITDRVREAEARRSPRARVGRHADPIINRFEPAFLEEMQGIARARIVRWNTSLW